MALSAGRTLLAVCEKAAQAICVIYDMNTLKRRRVITSSDCGSKAFTAVNFSKSNEKSTQYLVTISGEPDFSVIVWLWDK